jgi:hypothetical protein
MLMLVKGGEHNQSTKAGTADPITEASSVRHIYLCIVLRALLVSP